MDDQAVHGADPARPELERRWHEYLRVRSVPADHEEWLSRALSDYRDEIVHFGAQLLNDCAVRPWDEAAARTRYEKYCRAAREYNQDPDAWEAAFRAQFREALPPNLREKLAEHQK